MKEGDKSTYGHIVLRDYENPLLVCLEVLDTRSLENIVGGQVEQWHIEVVGYDRERDEDIVTQEVVISIIEKDLEYEHYNPTHDLEYNTMIWTTDEDVSFEPSLVCGVKKAYPWSVNHDGKVVEYSRYDSRETITSAVLSLIEDIHLVF